MIFKMSLKELALGAVLAAGCSCATAKTQVMRNNCSYYPDGRIMCAKDLGNDHMAYYRGGIIATPIESIAVATSTCAVTVIGKTADKRWSLLMDYGCDGLVDKYVGTSITGRLAVGGRDGNEDAFKNLFDVTFNDMKNELMGD